MRKRGDKQKANNKTLDFSPKVSITMLKVNSIGT